MERQYSFPAILSAIMTVVAIGLGLVAALLDEQRVAWFAGVLVLAGIGWALLALREVLGDE